MVKQINVSELSREQLETIAQLVLNRVECTKLLKEVFERIKKEKEE